MNTSDKIQLYVGDKIVHVAHSVKNLGTHFQTSMTMDRKINAIFDTCNYRIHYFGRVRLMK